MSNESVHAALIEKASSFLGNGEIDKAKEVYTQLCDMDQNDSESWLMLGALHGELGNIKLALELVQKAITIQPDFSRAYMTLGHLLRAQGNREQAVEAFRNAVELDEDDAEAVFSLASMLIAQDDIVEGITAYQRAVEIDPQYSDAWLMLGWSYRKTGDPAAAIPCYIRAVELDPNNSSAHLELANLQIITGNPEKAIDSYRAALKLQAICPEAYNNMGTALQSMGDTDGAIQCYEHALQQKPDYPEAMVNLGDMLQKKNRCDLAVGNYQSALQLRPDFARALYGLARANQELSNPAAAVEWYDKLLTVEKSDAVIIRRSTVLPVIIESSEQSVSAIERFENNLDSLIEKSLHINDPLVEIDHVNFYLAYYGCNIRSIQQKTAALFENCAPSLNYISSHCSGNVPRLGNKRITIGFVSVFFSNHTIATIFNELIRHISAEKFHVIVFGRREDCDFMQDSHEFIELPIDLAAAREIISQKCPDVLVYTDIGMDPFTYFLAFSRLAPVQCTTWGHPVTSGIRTIDYYISCKDFEPENAQEQYSEELVCLGSPPTYYLRPSEPSKRYMSEFGVEEQRNIYLCPQTLYKLHPDFDEVLGEILRADHEGLVVLFHTRYHQWSDILMSRLQKAIPDVVHRVRLLPRQRFDDYLGLLRTVDVVLDTFHFGGGNTTYQALAFGTPVVTLPGRLMRSRFAYACYKKMGVMDCVAENEEGYVQIATRLATDKEYNQHIKSMIRRANVALFEDLDVVDELEGIFLGMVERSRRQAANLSIKVSFKSFKD